MQGKTEVLDDSISKYALGDVSPSASVDVVSVTLLGCEFKVHYDEDCIFLIVAKGKAPIAVSCKGEESPLTVIYRYFAGVGRDFEEISVHVSRDAACLGTSDIGIEYTLKGLQSCITFSLHKNCKNPNVTYAL